MEITVIYRHLPNTTVLYYTLGIKLAYLSSMRCQAMSKQQSTNAICKHKVGDNWEPGCCGDDAQSKIDSTVKAVAQAQSQSRLPSFEVAKQ